MSGKSKGSIAARTASVSSKQCGATVGTRSAASCWDAVPMRRKWRAGSKPPASVPGFIGFAVGRTTFWDAVADLVPTVAPYCFDDTLAVLAAIEPFDFPDIRLDSGVLQHADGLEHQRRANPQVVGALVCLDAIHLRLRGRHQQLEHEQRSSARQ